MLENSYSVTIDKRGRMRLPLSAWETINGNNKLEDVFITRGMPAKDASGEICRGIAIYGARKWQEFVDQIENDGDFTAIDRACLKRQFLAYSVQCLPDSEGRLVIPRLLREYANLLGKTAVVEASGRVSLWNFETWLKLHQINNA